MKAARRTVPAPPDLTLAATALVEGVGTGRHLALRTGDADEFYDYKPYATGDPIGRIDWRVVARRDALFLRRRRQQAQLLVSIIVDSSASMGFRSLRGAPWPNKLESAKTLAAALAMIALRQGDRVSLVFGADVAAATPALAGLPSFSEFVSPLSRLTPAGSAGASKGLRAAVDATPGADMLILLSDALEPAESLAEAITAATARARSPRELILIQILSEDELRPTPMEATLVDPESPARARISGSSDAARIASVVAAHVDTVRSLVLHARGRYELHRTSESGVATLRRLLTRR